MKQITIKIEPLCQNFSFQLTDKGERLVDSIISVVFQYLLMIQQEPMHN